APAAARTLLVRAARPLGGATAADAPHWEEADDLVEVAADHLALIEAEAAATAEAIEKWIEA
ncbi:hypothetical protein, partial [Kitasatospora putterlickiae]|uniref:hypothetical protein n=1 Tax=Kitasatospora putterlickiae TaxID=221725 RepID=UPI0031D1D493